MNIKPSSYASLPRQRGPVSVNFGPKYKQVYSAVATKVASGIYVHGDRLASQQDLALEYGVSLMTMRQALRLLEADGFVEGCHGVGTFVVGPGRARPGRRVKEAAPDQVALILAETLPLSGYIEATVEALDRILRRQGRRLVMTSLWNKDIVQGVLPPVLAHSGVRGGIIEHAVEDAMVAFLQHHAFPLVVLGSHKLKAPVPQVVFNQEAALRLITRALLAAQGGRVHFLFHQTGYHYLDELVSGYLGACAEAGRGEQLHIIPPDYQDAHLDRELRAIIHAHPRPFALLAHAGPACEAQIGFLADRLYRKEGLDPAACPLVFYGDPFSGQAPSNSPFMRLTQDVDIGIGTALEVLEQALDGQAPARTVIEPALAVHSEAGQPAFRLSWTCSNEAKNLKTEGP